MRAPKRSGSFLSWLVVICVGLLGCGAGGEEAAAGSALAPSRATAWPPPLVYDQLAYAPDAERVLMVGGHVGYCWGSGVPGNHGVWSFDAGPRTWTQLTTEAPGHADGAAYDARAGRLVAWFSYATQSACNTDVLPTSIAETWAFDWRTGTWENRQPASSPPAGLLMGGAQIVYDARVGKVIMFGGLDLTMFAALLDGLPVTNAELFSDRTWAYDYEANTWTDLGASNPPPGRNSHMMVYDPDTERVLLFGGGDFDQNFNDLWAYDSESNAWTELDPPTRPTRRAYATMAYDTSAHRVVLFGGVNYWDYPRPNQTWTYDPATNEWALQNPEVAPSRRGWGGMAYSIKANVVVMYGGGPSRDEATDETWLFRTAPAAWTQVEPR